MSNIEQVIDQIRTFAGGDFAFVLTRRGRLVTRGAPTAMPEVGRIRLVAAAEPLVGTDDIGEVTMPREDLVPFGGAAPVDVYVAVAAEKAIICVVMSTWAGKIRVTPAIKAGIRALMPLLDGRGPQSSRSRRAAAAPPESQKAESQKAESQKPESQKPESQKPVSKKAESQKPASRSPVTRPPVTRPPETRPWAARPPEARPSVPPAVGPGEAWQTEAHWLGANQRLGADHACVADARARAEDPERSAAAAAGVEAACAHGLAAVDHGR